MVKLLTIIFSVVLLYMCVCLFSSLWHRVRGGIIDVCNDPDIFEKILVKAFVFEEEWGPT